VLQFPQENAPERPWRHDNFRRDGLANPFCSAAGGDWWHCVVRARLAVSLRLSPFLVRSTLFNKNRLGARLVITMGEYMKSAK
jgi:hypothetical protein